MILTLEKSKILKRCENQQRLENAEYQKTYSKELAEYEIDKTEYLEKLTKLSQVVKKTGEAPDTSRHYNKEFYLGYRLSKPILHTSDKHENLIEFLKLCDEEIIVIDTNKDKMGIGQMIQRAFNL